MKDYSQFVEGFNVREVAVSNLGYGGRVDFVVVLTVPTSPNPVLFMRLDVAGAVKVYEELEASYRAEEVPPAKQLVAELRRFRWLLQRLLVRPSTSDFGPHLDEFMGKLMCRERCGFLQEAGVLTFEKVTSSYREAA